MRNGALTRHLQHTQRSSFKLCSAGEEGEEKVDEKLPEAAEAAPHIEESDAAPPPAEGEAEPSQKGGGPRNRKCMECQSLTVLCRRER